MALKSMTGFARVEGAHATARWYWEVRSVNGRGLDLRLRLPPGMEAIEPKVRELTAKRFVRGSVSINLSITTTQPTADIRLNEAALAKVIAAAERVRQLTGGEPPRPEALLAIKGVLEVAEQVADETETAALHAALLKSLEGALTETEAARSAEGGRLANILTANLAAISALVATIEASPSRKPDAIRARIGELIQKLMDSGPGLDPVRLHQEAVLVATRADVEEELKRLKSHITAASELLASGEPAGRKFDFLAQEFNREANTLTAKANDAGTARAGLDLKTIIDQMREQVQNVE